MIDPATLQPVFWLPLALLAVGCIGFAWMAHALNRERKRVELLDTALGTIPSICYLIEPERVLRLDGRSDSAWPLNFHDLLQTLPEAGRDSIASRVRNLSTGGGSFAERVPDPDTGRVLEFVGHRLTNSGRPSHDFVWAGDVTPRETAATERRRAEQTASILTRVIEQLPVPVWWRGSSLATIQGNPSFSRLGSLGPASHSLAEAAIASGQAVQEQQEIQTRDGARVFDLTEVPQRNGGTIGFAIDRSDIVRLRAELERLTLGHHQVLESVITAIAIWSADTRLSFCNEAFEQLWGLDHDWLSTEPSLSEVLEALREKRALPEYADFRQFKAAQIELFATLTDPREEVLHLPDERTLRLWIRRHPFGGLIFTYEDVTDTLELERSYNTLTEVQRETLDNLFEAIAVFGSDGRLKLWNPTFAKMWQLDEADLIGRPHAATLVEKAAPFYSGDDWEAERAAAIGRITAYAARSERIERRGGTVLQMNTVPLPDGNVLLTYLDITDTARVQRALREKAEALETATRLKSEFIANVSYELRTPLNAIIGFAEILTNQYFGPLNERQLDYSRGVLESSQRLMSLINDILDLAAIEAGQLLLVRDPIDIHAMLAGILALTRERAQRLELNIAFDCPTDIGMVIADEQRVRQAVFNLVSNAIKFTPVGGTVTLLAARIGNEVALTVADTGVGIEPDQLGRVFDKFERGDPTSHPVGAGLGLSLVKSFIELHGGRVEIRSTPQQGTSVTCWLPSGSSSRWTATRSPPRKRADSAVTGAANRPVLE
jgi:signal transduction histidine kinase